MLAAHVRAAEAEACYESLSLLYVAMTRAKRAMYVITKAPGKSTSRNFPKLLAETLGEDSKSIRVGKLDFAGVFAEGESDWFTQLAPASPAVRATPEPGHLDPASVRKSRRLAARRPSAEKAGERNALQIGSLEGHGGADFGTAVHELFAEVEWAEAKNVEALAASWRSRGVRDDARDEVLACLRAPELAAVWTRPSAPRTEVWRERAFEMVFDGAWVTGVFDRVVVERDGGGRALRATVVDFKTDRMAGAEQMAEAVGRHAGQLNLYRQVAAVLTGLKVGAVSCELVFTRLRRVAQVPAAGEKF